MKKLCKTFIVVVSFLFSIFLSAAFAWENSPPKNQDSHLIPIVLGTDNNYVHPATVAMTSILENKDQDTFIDFNILISGKVSRENKAKLKKFEKLYKNCSVKLIDMNNAYSDAYVRPSPHLTLAMYYRLNIPTILTKYDKAIYLDCDTIVRKDLWEMFCIDLENIYFAGAIDPPIVGHAENDPEFEKDYSKKLDTENMQSYVNSGVLLMNLKKMRDDNMQEKFDKFVPTLKQKGLKYHDQDILNSTCYGKIKVLPTKYNVFSWHYIRNPSAEQPIGKHDCSDPTIIHYVTNAKPWKKKSCNACDVWEKYNKIAIKKIYDGKNPLEKNKKNKTIKRPTKSKTNSKKKASVVKKKTKK